MNYQSYPNYPNYPNYQPPIQEPVKKDKSRIFSILAAIAFFISSFGAFSVCVIDIVRAIQWGIAPYDIFNAILM